MTFTKQGTILNSASGESLNSNSTRSDYQLHAQIAARVNDDQNLRVSRPWFHTLALCDTDPPHQHQTHNPFRCISVHSLRYV